MVPLTIEILEWIQSSKGQQHVAIVDSISLRAVLNLGRCVRREGQNYFERKR